MKEVLDFTGRPITVGAFITYAAADGRSAVLRYGLVTALVPQHKKEYFGDREFGDPIRARAVRDRWGNGYEVLNNGRPVHLGFPSRCLVIEACVVPENVRTLLESK